MIGTKKRNRIILNIILLFLGLNLFFNHGSAIDINGFSYQGFIPPHEELSLNFLNNINFNIKTDVETNLSIEYQPLIFDRQISMIINNSNPILLNITSKFNFLQYLSYFPEIPKLNDSVLIFRYNCIYKLVANTSIEKVTFQFGELSIFGLSPTKDYVVAVYKTNQTSWELLSTEEKIDNSTSELYLEASINDLESDTPYFVTIFEVSEKVSHPSYDWLWYIILPASVILIALIIVISKDEYIKKIINRITPIVKGAHRLTLNEVLTNKNRNNIIDLVLENPGIHFNEILRKTELSPGNLVWHLDILETYKIIQRKRFENYVVYFPYYQKNPISNLDLKLQKSDLTLKVLQMIGNEPGIWNNLITKKLKINRKTIEYHIKKLMDLGLIYTEKTGSKRKLFLKKDSDYFSNLDN